MFELLTIAIFIWLFVKSIGLMLKITWGAAKLIAGILVVLAFPALFVCLLFLGGLAMLLPLVVLGLALGVLTACI